jgi:hypothetical protein
MRESASSKGRMRPAAVLSPALALAAALLLGACQSSGDSAPVAAAGTDGGGGSKSGFMKKLLAGGTDDRPDDLSSDYFLRTGYCPPVEIRGGTESLTVYEKGHDGEPTSVRYLASISDNARECQTVAGTLTIKVGVAGRVVAGPKGAPGNLTLPLRIAVVKQFQAPLFSELYQVPVTLNSPELASDYSYVVDQISVPVGPQDRDLIVYVGFDEGKPGEKAKGKKSG